MRSHAFLAVLVLVLLGCLAPGRAHAAQATVTAGWAGVWRIQEEVRNCIDGSLLSTSTYLDTLCAGDEYTLMAGPILTRLGYRYPACSGDGFTDTMLNLGCSITGVPCGYMGSCTSSSTKNVLWSRNGEEATSTLMSSYERTCYPLPPPCSGCTQTIGVWTRLSAATAECGGVPTRRPSWGSLKILYR